MEKTVRCRGASFTLATVMLCLLTALPSADAATNNGDKTTSNWRTKIPVGTEVTPITGLVIDELLRIFPETTVYDYGWTQGKEVRDVYLPGAKYGESELILGCERRTRVGFAGDYFGIAVLVCTQAVERIDSIAKSSANLISDMRNEATERFGTSPNDTGTLSAMMPKNGWRYVHQTLDDKSDYYFIPVVIFSHGVFTGYSAVLIDKTKRRAVVAQTEVNSTCREKKHEQSLLCTNLESVMRRLLVATMGQADALPTR